MENLHKKFVEYGANARKWMRKCELLLPEIYRTRVWKKKRFSSIYEYAAKLAGMSREKVNECLRIYEHIEDKPELMKVAEKKGLGALRPVVTIATRENALFWAEKVETMSKNALEVYTREFRPRTEFQPAKVQISMELDPEIAEKLQKLKGDKDWNELMKQLLAPKKEKPEPVETDSRHIPSAIQNYIRARSGGICEYPGCKRKAEIFHHTTRFSEHKCHDPDKIRYLCEGHERLAHLGLIERENKLPKLWHIRKQPILGWVDRMVALYRPG